MNFLPDVYVLCEVCGGKRYNHETLAVKYKGSSIADLLETPVVDALPILENIPQVRQKLQTLVDVGLGYIQLGQSAVTLSGGEAQRIKLARELSKRQTGKTVYLLDEPTTGLHFDDVKKLLDVLHRLTDLGNTIIIIEHNLDVIRDADWIIDLGPEGGEQGGRIVAQGTPGGGANRGLYRAGAGAVPRRERKSGLSRATLRDESSAPADATAATSAPAGMVAVHARTISSRLPRRREPMGHSHAHNRAGDGVGRAHGNPGQGGREQRDRARGLPRGILLPA